MRTENKHPIVETTPHVSYRTLFQQPPLTPRGSFWDAFAHLQNGNAKAAKAALYQSYFDPDGIRKDSPRIKMLQALARCYPITIENLDWPELLALAGCSNCIHQLLTAGQISAVHAVHAEIECGRSHTTNPHLKPSDTQMADLLTIYRTEENMLLNSAHTSPLLKKWLRTRRMRAMTYVDIYEGDEESPDPSHSSSDDRTDHL